MLMAGKPQFPAIVVSNKIKSNFSHNHFAYKLCQLALEISIGKQKTNFCFFHIYDKIG